MKLFGRLMYSRICSCQDCSNVGHNRRATRCARRSVRAAEKDHERRHQTTDTGIAPVPQVSDHHDDENVPSEAIWRAEADNADALRTVCFDGTWSTETSREAR